MRTMIGVAAALVLASGALAQGSGGEERTLLRGVLRCFCAPADGAGHPDFGRPEPGLCAGVVADTLGPDDKPVFISGGFPVRAQGADAAGNPIIGPRRYIEPRPGDVAPRLEPAEAQRVESGASLDTWFRDVPGVNRRRAAPVELTFNSGAYIFDGSLPVGCGRPASQSGSASEPGAPVDPSDSGDSGACAGFTWEMTAQFTCEPGAGAVMRFESTGDLWVFIDGRLVIDLGGEHDRAAQQIDLDRLPWLRDGQSHSLTVLLAERGSDASDLRIDSTTPLRQPARERTEHIARALQSLESP
ncbi:MAG: fibro-slime domain-containing protein [Phycisphaerales bacterium JB039]